MVKIVLEGSPADDRMVDVSEGVGKVVMPMLHDGKAKFDAEFGMDGYGRTIYRNRGETEWRLWITFGQVIYARQMDGRYVYQTST